MAIYAIYNGDVGGHNCDKTVCRFACTTSISSLDTEIDDVSDGILCQTMQVCAAEEHVIRYRQSHRQCAIQHYKGIHASKTNEVT